MPGHTLRAGLGVQGGTLDQGTEWLAGTDATHVSLPTGHQGHPAQVGALLPLPGEGGQGAGLWLWRGG